MADKYNISDVFISYSRKDKIFAEKVFTKLKSEDREVWADWEDIPLTADWWEEIQAGIEGADTFVFIISPDSVASQVCYDEIDHAMQNNKRIVPILYREVTDDELSTKLHQAIKTHNWVFFREGDDFEIAYQRLIQAIETDLAYVQAHTRYLVRATEWDDKDRRTSYLLTDTEILEAEAWLAESGAKSPKPTQLQTEYIFASRAERSRVQRRNQIIASGAGIIFLTLFILMIFQVVEAQNQRDIAEAQRDIAEAQRAEAVFQSERAERVSLAANSQVALTNNNTDLSIALALAANAGNPSLRSGETERALAEAAYSAGTISRFTGHEDDVYAVAFSPDGELAASGDNSGILLVWDVESNEELQIFAGHNDRINAVDFNPTAELLVSASCGERDNTANNDCISGEIILWNVETGEEVRRLEGHTDDVTTVTFDTTGNRILSGSADRTMRLWDVETGEQIGIYRRHLGKVVDVAFHPLAPDLAVSLAIDTPPTLWDLDTGREVIRYYEHDVRYEPNLSVGSVAFSPDGSQILGSYGIPMRIWDTVTGELIREFLGHGSYINSVAYSVDGQIALSSAWRENSFRVWDTDNGIELRRFEGHGGVIRAITISDDGRYALSGSDDNTVRVWDLANGAEVLSLPGHTDNIFATIYSPYMENGYIVASAGLDELIRIWDVETRQQIARLDGHTDDVWTLAYSPDGSLLVSGGEDNTARIWDVDTYEQIGVLEVHNNWVTTVAISPDGQEVLTGSNDTKIRLWDIDSGELLEEYAGDDGQLRSVVFTPDGTHFLAGANTARLINIETGEVVQEYLGHSSRINSAAFSSDGSLLATGSADATVRLWDTITGRPLSLMEGHSSQVRSVMFNANDTTILSSSADATIRLWSVNGLELRIFSGHDTWVNQAAFSPDGRFAVSGSWDNTIKIWHIHSVEQLIEWTNINRYVRGLTCFEELVYRLRREFC